MPIHIAYQDWLAPPTTQVTARRDIYCGHARSAAAIVPDTASPTRLLTTTVFPPDLPSALESFYLSQHAVPITHNSPVTPLDQPTLRRPKHTVTYMAKHYDDSFSSYKKRRLIDGSVYVLTSFCDHILPDGLASALHTAPYPIFQASTNIVDVHYNHPYWACAAVDNKADTLTQSQMLKDSDRALFIASQEPEIRGLQKMDVFEVQPISTKPITAKLLSAIWSY